MAWSPAARRRQKEKAFRKHRDRVLANPAAHSRLAVERNRRNLTQAQLAKLCSLSPAAISDLERGTRSGWKNTRARISWILQVPHDDLFGSEQ
jgi:DNA-binding XRE family transcriptional regulator